MNNKIETYKILINGKVQGVGYRYWFSSIANNMELKGYICNLTNTDQVEAIIQGETSNIDYIIKKSKLGPNQAIVKQVISNKMSNNIIYSDFEIKY